MSDFFKLNPALLTLADEAEQACAERFARADRTAAYCGERVLSAFIEARVSEACMKGTTGYGYGDVGRDTLDKVFAKAMEAEDALVRHSFVSGTHALSVALFGVLRTGDRMVSLTGRPYDTLEEVIGLRGKGNGSLTDYGIVYEQLDLLANGRPDLAGVFNKVKGAKVAYIQRSRGYSLRPSLTVADIAELAKAAKAANPDVIVMVDNCYGEFVEMHEPCGVGADIAIGSLIKNTGGGIAETGGYICGRADLVELCSYRLTCVGMGREVGCSLNQNKAMYQGVFLAPQTVANAVKTADFACELFGRLGFEAFPSADETRGDIIAAILLKTPENLISFCKGIQAGAPVDSFVSPEPWDMPGYESQVIMAAGAFNGGASIELSADGPLREPYGVWLQGGLTYPSGKMGVLLAAQSMADSGSIRF